MFCSKCGEQLPVDSRFCIICGTPVHIEAGTQPPYAQTPYAAPPALVTPPEAPPAPSVTTQPAPVYTAPQPATAFAAPAPPQPVGNDPIISVPYKGSGEQARFYEDRVEFGGHSIRYADVAEMDTSGVTSSMTALIFYQSDFSGRIGFTLRDGRKEKIKVKGFSIYGIGTTRSAKKRFQPLFSAAYNVAARAMAKIALEQIRQGATINIAGMEINSNGATYKKLLRKEPVYISRHNFGACGLDGYFVRIVDKTGNKLLSTSDDNANALLLPYILTTLFGN